MPMAEELFAQALLQIEPEKVVGGIKERQDWLALVLEVQSYILTHRLSEDLFKRGLMLGAAAAYL